MQDVDASAPKLGFRLRKLGPYGTTVLMAAALAFLARMVEEKFLYVFSGQVFMHPFDPICVGTCMDQPTIGKWFIAFGVLSAIVLPYVAWVRRVSDRGNPACYWTFTVLTVAVGVFLLGILTMPFYWLLQYIDAMGFTARRVYGLVYGVGGLGVILAFLRWAIRPPRQEGASAGTNQ